MNESEVISGRLITLGAGCTAIPERLLLAQARGQAIFITGAGTSMGAGLPNFRKLVIDTYERIDPSVHAVLSKIPSGMCNHYEAECDGLNPAQIAEVRRFVLQDYDVVLGMLERRMDGDHRARSTVRKAISDLLHDASKKPGAIHRSLMRLAQRGAAISIITTNFDLLLEAAAKRNGTVVQSYSLGAIPRPSRREDFAGIFHIHGALDSDPKRLADMIVSDQDFGEFYLRRRIVSDFIYDAARLFNLVLVGYSANDPPMRYLLNAVAADGGRFDDLKERFTFISCATTDEAQIEDWNKRGITPIPYIPDPHHESLAKTLSTWADIADNQKTRDDLLKKLVRKSRDSSTDAERDLFDHLFRRSNDTERRVLVKLAADNGASIDWLNSMIAIASEQPI